MRVVSLPSKIAAVGFGMASMIILNSYTAGLTANAATVAFSSSITSVADVASLHVGTPTGVFANFVRYGFVGVPLGSADTYDAGFTFLNALAVRRWRSWFGRAVRDAGCVWGVAIKPSAAQAQGLGGREETGVERSEEKGAALRTLQPDPCTHAPMQNGSVDALIYDAAWLNYNLPSYGCSIITVGRTFSYVNQASAEQSIQCLAASPSMCTALRYRLHSAHTHS